MGVTDLQLISMADHETKVPFGAPQDPRCLQTGHGAATGVTVFTQPLTVPQVQPPMQYLLSKSYSPINPRKVILS